MIMVSKMRWIVLCSVLCSSVALAGIAEFSPGLLRYVATRWGKDAPVRLADWRDEERKHIAKQRGPVPSADETMTDMEDFNWYWNNIRYYTDAQHWGVLDYWATPVETLASEGADCEDYAIAKYFSLKALGVPVQNLRITYVRALRWNEPHMVLAYYPTVDADPYILDNLSKRVSHASERNDLVPVYSFNDEDVWLPGATAAGGKSSQIRLWRGLLDKMEKERAM
ncbi:MAG: transglutaminase-like cysteine peptidase [Proteobacteria bacterium]|nr:transglutaminase-like cysteine peptidase [Pseudomonadota bacterium]